MRNKRVLIIDDEPDIVSTLKFALELEGLDCIEAYDGEDALLKSKHEEPDLILLDVMMPKMNGYKVSRLLKFDQRYKHIPIIMLTARAQVNDVELGGETGADEYITKPFDMTRVVTLVKKYLEPQ